MADTQKLISVVVQQGHGDSTVLSAALSPDERTLFTLDHMGMLVAWDVRTAKQMNKYYLGDSGISPEFGTYEGISKPDDNPTRLSFKNGALHGWGSDGLYSIDTSAVAAKVLYSDNEKTWFDAGRKHFLGFAYKASGPDGVISLFNVETRVQELFDDKVLRREGILKELALHRGKPDIGFDEQTGHLVIAYPSPKELGELRVAMLKRTDKELEFIKWVQIKIHDKSPWWLSPAADYLLWVEGKTLHKKNLPDESEETISLHEDQKSIQHLEANHELGYCAIAEAARLTVYDLKTREIIFSKTTDQLHRPLTFSPGASSFHFMATCTTREAVFLWKLAPEVKTPERAFSTSMSKIKQFAPQGDDALNILFENNTLYTLELKNELRLRPKYLSEKKILQLAISPGGRYTAVAHHPGGQPHKTFIIQQSDNTTLSIPIHPPGFIKLMAFSSDSRFLAVAFKSGAIRIYDTEDLNGPVAEWNHPGIHCLAFHPDAGRHYLAAAIDERQIRMYDWLPEGHRDGTKVVMDLEISKIFKLTFHFSDTGRYLILRGKGRSEILDIENLEAKPVKRLYAPPDQEEPGGWKKGRHNTHFTASHNYPSPIFLKNDTLLLLQERETTGIHLQIWEPETLEKYLENPGEDSPFQPKYRIKEPAINYFAFSRLKGYPILVFYSREDGEILFFNYEKEAPYMGGAYPVNEKKFIVFSPDNFYYTTAEGYDLIAFKKGNEVYPIEQFDLWFNRPDKVLPQISLSQQWPASEQEAAEFDKLVQLYELAYEKRMGRLFPNKAKKAIENEIRAKTILLPDSGPGGGQENKGSKARDASTKGGEGLNIPTLELKRNDGNPKNRIPLSTNVKKLELLAEGKEEEVKLERLVVYINGVPVNDGFTEGIRGEQAFKIPIALTLSQGRNEIRALVLNQKGVESLQDSIRINCSAPPLRPSSLYLVGIGVGIHEDQDKKLDFPRANIEELLEAFRGHVPGLMEEHILKIFDEEATLNNIRSFLRDEVKAKLAKTQADDRVIVIFSGHGIRNALGNLFLSTHDMNFAVDLDDEAFAEKTKGLPYEELESLFEGLGARNKLLLVDACNSGELEAVNTGPDGDFEVVKNELTQLFGRMNATFIDLRRGNGTTIITGAQGWQEASEGGSLKNSNFIHSFLVGIGAKKNEQGDKKLPADLNGDGKVTISELVDYLVEEVPKLSVSALLADHFSELEKARIKTMKKDIQEVLLADLSFGLPQIELYEKLKALLNEILSEEDISPPRIKKAAKNLAEIQQPSRRAENYLNDWTVW